MEKITPTKPLVRKTKTGIFGLILVLAGLILIADQFDIFSINARSIIFSWQALLILLGIVFLSQRDGKFTGTILLVIGTFFILPKFIQVHYDYMKLFWPFFLIFIGVIILFKGFFGKGQGFSASTMNGDAVEDVNIFGGHDRIITNENFKGGEIINIFGGSKYNLLQSTLAPGKNVMEVVMVFGGSKIVVPQDWDVKVDVTAIFGGFSDKRMIPDNGVSKSDRTLIIKGVVIFGGGEIINFDN